MRYTALLAAALGVFAGAAVVLLAVLTSGTLSSRPAQRDEAQRGDMESLRPSAAATTGACGRELWAIKTLTDAEAGQVSLTPVRTTIADLASAPAPSFSYTRSRSTVTTPGTFYTTELTRWRLTGTTLTGYRLEPDSDIHLVLRSPRTGATMIAEIPDPACMGGSRVRQAVARVRAKFVGRHNLSYACFDCLRQTVTISGVGFFDALHGQHGVARNGVELHPVLGIRF